MLTEHEQQVVQRGLAAADLLANENFRDIIHSLTIESFAVFTETKPHQSEDREAQYNLCQGLKAIEQELLARVQAKDAIERRLDEDEDQFITPIDDADFLEDF